MTDPKDPPYAPPYDGTDGLPVFGGAAERVILPEEQPTHYTLSEANAGRLFPGAPIVERHGGGLVTIDVRGLS